MRWNREKKSHCCLTDNLRNCLVRDEFDEVIAPLSQEGRPGRVKVCKVTGDRKICARMASMGVYPGVEADIVCALRGNRCVLKVQGGTISLDADITANILVTHL